ELLDPGGLAAFRPDAVLLALAARDFLGAVPLAAPAEAADAAVAAAVADLRALWARARGLGALVIQQTFLDLEPPLFGGLDAGVPGAPARLVQRLNAALADAASAEGVLLLDLARAAARDGLDAWHDPVRWLQAKMEIAPQAGPMYGELVARLLAAARGKSRKCLVLDLDNTLWGGVIGDDGLAGIVIGQGSGVGEAYLALQAYAKRLSERGIVLAVCSKNDPRIAEVAFDHPEMLLKRTDFAAFVANWTDKATNLRAIARALNIGLDSLVFVDDNPVEREQVRAALPEVAVPELPPDPAHYVRILAEAGYFEAVAFTAEDRDRAGQYAANLERESLAASGDMDAFLGALGMTVEAGPVTALNLARVTQLLNKTNQFNTTTIRRTEAEVAALAADPAGLTLQFRLVDKFGDNGIVSVMLLEPARGETGSGALEIVNWVMSCRVFGRQLEEEALNILAETARARGISEIRAAFVPTEKNGVIADLFPRLGFAPGGEGRWTLSLAAHARRATRISRKEAA
ncbi:MAG TPA: HAD-IIIC family phosphatase, partial [Amaricoccus sp.]|uniref:HAD-IIIC family phosphatase n=1 Tax=Amaricoccus sp. TaxID=1872485 RepID=UPI002C21C41E